MTSVLIGSRAARYWFPDWREPNDTDYFSDPTIEGAEVFWHPSLHGFWPEGHSRVATPGELYTIKMSHSAWDLHGTWEKHMHDAMILKSLGCGLIRELYDILYPIWEHKHGKKVMNLNQDKDDFFSDAVIRKYDHDSIHESVAINDRPMYEYYLKDGSTVAMDMAKVWASPKQAILDLFAEEIAATALERWVIPSNYKVSPGLAWGRAVKKTVTSLTKGRSSLFIATNYDYYRKAPYDYIGRHKSNLHCLIPLED